MSNSRFVTFLPEGSVEEKYGFYTDNGVIDLHARFQDRWSDLKAVVTEGAFAELEDAASGLSADFSIDSIALRPPVSHPEKILCIGVN